MLDFSDETQAAPAYEDDFVVWLDAQAGFLQDGRLELLDKDHLIDELTAMANRHRDKVQSRMEVLLAHLLKCQFQPDHKTRSWESTLLEQRHKIKRLIAHSPSLRHVVAEKMDYCYQYARRMAATETGLPLDHFPPHSPYSAEQMLDEDFLP